MTASSGSSVLERLLRRERLVTAAGLAVLCALAWLYLVRGAGMGDMAGMDHPAGMGDMAAMAGMPGMGAAPAPWGLERWILVVVMWTTMMVAMMTPAAAPTVLLYGLVARRAAEGQAAATAKVTPPWVFAAGYFLVWTAFSVAAAAAQWALETRGLVSHHAMSSQSRWLSAGVLAAAGVYQLSPLQSACLSHCRSPAAFLARHWRPGALGAVRLGVLHGAWCVGCCWLVMAILFVGGVMNLVWIAAIAVLVMAEKLLPGGPWIARLTGLVLLGWALVIVLA